SAFSERSPSAAAAASARTTSGRRTRQRSSSSAFSAAWPSGVTSAVPFSTGGRQRPNLDPRLPCSAAAADAAPHPAQDASADLVADGARGLLGPRQDDARAAPGPPEPFADRLPEAAFGILLAGRRWRWIRLFRRGLDLLRQHFLCRLAVDGPVVLRADRAA